MNFTQQQHAKSPRRALQGPRPSPLKICRDSHSIRKPPVPLPASPYRPPVIIYLHSPEIIHTEAREFMTLVQLLTGRVNAHGNSCILSSSSGSSSSIQSQTCNALPHSHTSVPVNPNHCPVDASSLGGGELGLPVKEYNSIVSGGSNPSGSSETTRSQRSTVQSLISPTINPSGLMSPFSPNLIFQSPRLLSPNIFREFSLCTTEPDYFYSPRHMLCMLSETSW